MSKLFIGSAAALTLTATSLLASPILSQPRSAWSGQPESAQVWLAKDNGKNNGKGNSAGNGKKIVKGNGNAGNGNAGNGNAGNGNAGKGNGKGKPDHAGGPKAKPEHAKIKNAANGKAKGDRGRQASQGDDRDTITRRILETRAPENRDMTRILAATGLTLATSGMVFADIPEDRVITYSNCPPGLAKKNPPCVPPGLAKKGVTYQDWVSYDRDDYVRIWDERRDGWLDTHRDLDPDRDLLLLRSGQIARLYDLDPAPEGSRYALIDGLPVLLDHKDYRSLLLVNQMAAVPDGISGVPIAPTAALSQDELIDMYRLPRLGADENYAVVNGRLVRLNDSNYEMLQMIRIARAIL